MVPSAFGQRFQFPQRLVRLAQPQPVFGAPDPEGVGEWEPVFAGSCLVASWFVAVRAPAIRLDRKVDGFAQFLKGGDKLQRCSAWKGRQSFFGYALGRLINEMIAWRQYPDRVHEALFLKRCFLTLHVSSFMGAIVTAEVGQRLSMRKIFWKIAKKLTRHNHKTCAGQAGLPDFAKVQNPVYRIGGFWGLLVSRSAFCDCGVMKPLEPPVCR
jgi:hypothetical protein